MVVRNIKRAAEKDKLCCGDLLCCVLGLSSTDAEVFSKLRRPMSVRTIMSATGKSQTRVQISLQTLGDLGLVRRTARKGKRGVKYIYSPADTEQVKKRLNRELNESYRKLKKEISEL